jgi:hypothetical protein
MKKMIFSAVALVAFSLAGMANNGEGEKKVETKKEVSTRALPCFEQYKKDKTGLIAAGFSENTASAIAESDFMDCLDNTYGPI